MPDQASRETGRGSNDPEGVDHGTFSPSADYGYTDLMNDNSVLDRLPTAVEAPSAHQQTMPPGTVTLSQLDLRRTGGWTVDTGSNQLVVAQQGYQSSSGTGGMVAGTSPAAGQQWAGAQATQERNPSPFDPVRDYHLLVPLDSGDTRMGSGDYRYHLPSTAANPGQQGQLDAVNWQPNLSQQPGMTATSPPLPVLEFNDLPIHNEHGPLASHEERPLPPNENGFRHEFLNWEEALGAMVEHLEPREVDDPTFPWTDALERMYVEQITDAINDVSNTRDHPPGSKGKAPAAFTKFRDNRYPQRQIQLLAWNLMTRVKDKQQAGPLVPSWQRSRRAAAFASYADAVDSLCRALREQKTIGKRLLDPSVVDDVVDHPEAHLKRATQNRRLNKTKAEQIRRGRETAGQPTQESGPSGEQPPPKKRKVSEEAAVAAAEEAVEEEEEEEEEEEDEEDDQEEEEDA